MLTKELNFTNLTAFIICVLVTASIFGASKEARALAQGPQNISLGIVYYCDNPERDGAARFFELFEDDGRFSEVSIVDGAFFNPSTQDLVRDFDCVVAYTNDDRICPPDSSEILDQASQSLAGFASLGNGLVLMSFSFSLSEGLGLGPAVFEPGLSPFQKVQFGNGDPGPVDIDGASDTPVACARILSGVLPFSTTLNNFVALSDGASLCASYDNGEEFLAVNERGNIVGINAFPSNEDSFDPDSYGRLLTNAAFEACTFNETTMIPTLSEWGLMAMVALLGTIGLLAVRRRNSAAKG